jgi:hypothetical protein
MKFYNINEQAKCTLISEFIHHRFLTKMQHPYPNSTLICIKPPLANVVMKLKVVGVLFPGQTQSN